MLQPLWPSHHPLRLKEKSDSRKLFYEGSPFCQPVDQDGHDSSRQAKKEVWVKENELHK